MGLPPEHKALLFVGAVAVLGAGVRVLRAATRDAAPSVQPALDHQVQSADSSAHAEKDKRGRGRAPRPRARAASNSPAKSTPQAPLERTGYIGKRLDLDVASAAQIDSLPGVLPNIARRIVADRATRGPFLSMNGLRRVSGVGPRVIERIDSLVTFSGTVVQPTAGDTVTPRAKRSRAGARP